MIKDIITANELVTPNQKEINILKENFPSCFRADGSFDMVRFSEFLKDKIDISHEGYELKFLGKNYAKMLASLDTETVIVPDETHNSLPENINSENVYISGDNLDGLKHLLKSYAGEVKCIYIVPPYSTGSDGFVYNDKFSFCVICTRGKNTRIRAIQNLLKSSVGNEDENHEVEFLLSQISNDSINDTTITIPASILVCRKDAVGRKLSEFDGIIIHPMRKEQQVIFLEAKNRDRKPSFGKNCLVEKFGNFSFEYVADDIMIVDYDAYWKYSIR